MNKRIFIAIKWMLVIFVSVYSIVQAYSFFINPITTDTVYVHSAYTGYSTTGFVIRNETIVEKAINGVLSYEIADGGRVSKGGTIATVYSNSTDADNRIKIAELDKRIEALEKIQTYNDLNAADISTVNRNIYESLSNVIGATQNGRVEATDYYDVLLENTARKQIIVGEATDFNVLLTTLKSQRDSLKASSGQAIDAITSPQSGYVIYSVDGYEGVLNVDELDDLNADTLNGIKRGNASDNSVCKIVSGYEWYIAVALPFSESLNLRLDSKVILRTELHSLPELEVTVKHINKESVGSEAVVVFSCDTMNSELAQQRNLDVTVVYEEYEGLKVDNRAIRVVEGKKGVYVYLASQIKFIPVEVVWSGENFSIVKREAKEGSVLRIYDEIIVKGKNLYDGKIIN